MGQREDMLLALGIDPTAGVNPPPAPPGIVDVIKGSVRDNADAFRKAIVGSKLGPTDPERDLLYSQGNPVAVAAARAGGQYAAGKMDDGIAKRGLEYLSGAPVPEKPAAGGVGTAHGLRGLENVSGSTEVKPQYVPDVNVQPAPMLGAAGARPSGISGGGGGFGGLEKNLRDAQGRQLHGFDEAADVQHQLGVDQAGRTMAESDMREADALARRRDAEEQMRIEADAQQRHRAFLAKQEQLADDIAKQGIDPGRLLRNQDIGTQVTFGLGSALGEMFSSNGQNSYLNRVKEQVAQDIESQVAGNDAKRESYKARSSLFDKMLAESGDRRLAGMQTQKMLYDAIDKKMLADAARLGVPEIMTKAEVESQKWQRDKQALDVQIQQQSLQQARAAAAAAAAAQRAAEERAWQHQKDLIQLDHEQQKIDVSREGKGKDVGERRVVLDGKDEVAVNKEAAGKWNEYNHGRAVFALALNKLKAAREAGDVGAYDAARAQLIEEYPKLLGYTRAPTEGQISHTVGPNAIPEYNHWYNHAKYGPVGAATYKRDQGRGEEKIRFLEETLATSDKAMRENTFGAAAGTSPHFKTDAKEAK